MRRHFRELYPLYVASLIYLTMILGLVFKFIPPTNLTLFINVVFLLSIYITCMYMLTTRFMTHSNHLEVGAALLFFAMSVLLIACFGAAWTVFPNNFKGADNYSIDGIDPFYFSASVFTTLGFGDFAPCTRAGKILASCEALMGATHMVTFFSIVFSIASNRQARRISEADGAPALRGSA
jgi:hypothetical protein